MSAFNLVSVHLVDRKGCSFYVFEFYDPESWK